MKIEISEWKSDIKEISLKDAMEEFFEEYGCNLKYGFETEDLDDFINGFKEINKEEEELLREEIKKEFDKKLNKYKQEEINQLKNKKSIIKWLKNLLEDFNDAFDCGEVGYLLSAEEIFNLILKNGQK